MHYGHPDVWNKLETMTQVSDGLGSVEAPCDNTAVSLRVYNSESEMSLLVFSSLRACIPSQRLWISGTGARDTMLRCRCCSCSHHPCVCTVTCHMVLDTPPTCCATHDFATTPDTNTVSAWPDSALYCCLQGGMSRATRTIHVSEDVFSGYCHTLRGARIKYEVGVVRPPAGPLMTLCCCPV